MVKDFSKQTCHSDNLLQEMSHRGGSGQMAPQGSMQGKSRNTHGASAKHLAALASTCRTSPLTVRPQHERLTRARYTGLAARRQLAASSSSHEHCRCKGMTNTVYAHAADFILRYRTPLGDRNGKTQAATHHSGCVHAASHSSPESWQTSAWSPRRGAPLLGC